MSKKIYIVSVRGMKERISFTSICNLENSLIIISLAFLILPALAAAVHGFRGILQYSFIEIMIYIFLIILLF